jgi:hypothetical protein
MKENRMKKIIFMILVIAAVMLPVAASADLTGTWMWMNGTTVRTADVFSDGTVYVEGEYLGTWEVKERVLTIETSFFGNPYKYFVGILSDSERQIIGDGITLQKK